MIKLIFITILTFTYAEEISSLDEKSDNLNQKGYEYQIPDEAVNSTTQNNYQFQSNELLEVQTEANFFIKEPFMTEGDEVKVLVDNSNTNTNILTTEKTSIEAFQSVTSSNEHKHNKLDFIDIVKKGLPSQNDHNKQQIMQVLLPPLDDSGSNQMTQENYDIFNSPFDESFEEENSYVVDIHSNSVAADKGDDKIDIRILGPAKKPGEIQSVQTTKLKDTLSPILQYPLEEKIMMQNKDEAIPPLQEEIVDTTSTQFNPPPPDSIIISPEVTSAIQGTPTPVQKLLLQKIQISNGNREASYIVSNLNSDFPPPMGVNFYQISNEYQQFPRYLHLFAIPSAQSNYFYQVKNPFLINHPIRRINPVYEALNYFERNQRNQMFAPMQSHSSSVKAKSINQWNWSLPASLENNKSSYQVEPR